MSTAKQQRMPTLNSHLPKTRQGLTAAYLFIRFPVLNFSAMLPLLGAMTVTPALTGTQLLGLLAVAVAFHCFAYVLNDVIDLPVDRSEPLRQEYPLVRDIISQGQALGFVMLQIPLALLCTAWLAGNTAAYGVLLSGFALMAVYDLWGKRNLFPPLTDAVQGLAWGCMALYGALITDRPPTILTGALLGWVLVLVLLINGVHGALRDLTNDLRAGARTTAILLGARPSGAGGLIIPTRLVFYALLLQALLSASSLLPLIHNWLEYGPLAWYVTTASLLALAAVSLVLLVLALRSAANKWNMILFGLWHLLISLGSMVLLLAFHMEPAVLTVLIMVYLLPVLTMWLRYGFKWG